MTVTTGSVEPGTLAFVTDLCGQQFDAQAPETGGPVRATLEVCRDGRWRHPVYGDITVTLETRHRFAQNFAQNVRRGPLPIDYDHHLGPAAGWFVTLRNEGESLLAEVELTARAAEQVRRGEYRFFSPEWHPDWEDPETGHRHGPTLFGGGLTNRPFFRGMAAICCREESDMTETGIGSEGTLTLAEAQELRERVATLTAIEQENATLRSAEERRSVEATLTALRFSEGRVLAPACRTQLAEAVAALPQDGRTAVLTALRGLRFMELGERGFTPAADPAADELSETEERSLRDLAARNNLRFEEVRRTFLEARTRRSGQ